MSNEKEIEISLDEDVILYFQKQSEISGIPYQTLISSCLSDCIREKGQAEKE